jgi:hypothetical protein
MIEVMAHESPFDSTNGWNLEKKRRLIEDAIVVLSQMDKNEFRWFRCSINQSAIGRLRGMGEYVPLDAHKHCALVLAEMMVNSYWCNCPNPEGAVLCYDRNEPYIAGIRKEWLARKTSPGRAAVRLPIAGTGSRTSSMQIKRTPRLSKLPTWCPGLTRELYRQKKRENSLG